MCALGRPAALSAGPVTYEGVRETSKGRGGSILERRGDGLLESPVLRAPNLDRHVVGLRRSQLRALERWAHLCREVLPDRIPDDALDESLVPVQPSHKLCSRSVVQLSGEDAPKLRPDQTITVLSSPTDARYESSEFHATPATSESVRHVSRSSARTRVVAHQAADRLPVLDVRLCRAPDLAACAPAIRQSGQAALHAPVEIPNDHNIVVRAAREIAPAVGPPHAHDHACAGQLARARLGATDPSAS